MNNTTNNPGPPPITFTFIPVPVAIDRTWTWRQFIQRTTIWEGAEVPRAALISWTDIETLYNMYKERQLAITGFRAYFTCNENDTPDNVTEISLIFVPVGTVDGVPDSDMLYFAGPDASLTTAVVDFTKPCPQACDTISPLY